MLPTPASFCQGDEDHTRQRRVAHETLKQTTKMMINENHEAEAKEHLTEQREKFASARQELTAEVIAYQRDLDELAHQKRQLQVPGKQLGRPRAISFFLLPRTFLFFVFGSH